MMTKITSAKVALLKQLGLVPVLAGALFLFANKVSARTGPIVSDQKTSGGNGDKPMSVVDIPITPVGEYEVILKKYGITDTLTKPKAANFKFSATDRKHLHDLYLQMTPAQQRKQLVLFIPVKPLPKVSPTQTQLNNFADASTYGVWINEKKVSNAELAKYKPDDFDQLIISKLTKAAINHDKYKYQVDLMTKAYYANYLEKEARGYDYLYYTDKKAKGL